jgi:hypothetical protein
MRQETFVVQVNNVFDKFKIDVKPLNFDALNELISLSMDSGFYGNFKIMKFIIEKGCTDKEDAKNLIQNYSYFTLCSLVREIWFITLKALASQTKKLMKLTGDDPNKLKVRYYKFTDLATPGLLWFIVRDLDLINADQYSHLLLHSLISNVAIQGKKLSKKKSKQFLVDNFEIPSTTILNLHGIEGNYLKELPSAIFRNSREKFYAMAVLIRTIDWRQYFDIVSNYNKALSKLILKSNLMGGIISKEDQPHLSTGIAAFIDLVRTPAFNKITTITSLLTDVVLNKKQFRYPRYTKIIKNYFNESMEEITRENPNSNHEELFFALLKRFASKISTNKKLVVTIEFEYWEEFQKAFIEDTKSNIREIIAQSKKSLIPDCYILVEGDSDLVCYSHFIEILDSDLIINVIKCGGKEGVARKYRELINERQYIGSIVTVLDSDARIEHEDIQRIDAGNVLTSHYIYKSGTLEDIFNKKLIVQSLNSLYPGSTEITENDLGNSQKIEDTISRIVWEKKQASFNKNDFAIEISKRIKTKKMIPKIALEIVNKSLKLAEKNAKSKPRLSSILSNRPPIKVISELEELLRHNTS